eukprot:12907385-Alexandrium_andersonii.AAC.1
MVPPAWGLSLHFTPQGARHVSSLSRGRSPMQRNSSAIRIRFYPLDSACPEVSHLDGSLRPPTQ